MLGLVARVADRAVPISVGLETALRELPFLNADETGWKMDGERWQMWCFCTEVLAVFRADKSRSSDVVKGVLGEDFSGVVGADFHAAYDFLQHTQRCLVHLLREVSKELQVVPKDRFLKSLKRETKALIEIHRRLDEDEVSEDERDRLRQDALKHLQRMLDLRPGRTKASKRLAKRLARYSDDLAAFVDVPGLDCHNNRAERQLRPVVLLRKTSFGNRTPEGADRYSHLATVIDTGRLRGCPPVDLVREIMAPGTDPLAIAARLLDTS